jgi:hypothetical protein
VGDSIVYPIINKKIIAIMSMGLADNRQSIQKNERPKLS